MQPVLVSQVWSDTITPSVTSMAATTIVIHENSFSFFEARCIVFVFQRVLVNNRPRLLGAVLAELVLSKCQFYLVFFLRQRQRRRNMVHDKVNNAPSNRSIKEPFPPGWKMVVELADPVVAVMHFDITFLFKRD